MAKKVFQRGFMIDFAWNKRKVKSIVSGPEGRTQIETTPKDIVTNPNRHQFESILASLCYTVSELVQIQEQQAQRINELMKLREGENHGNVEHSSGNG